MRPQKQLNRHQPAAGIYGDCHRTAIAIILDLNAAEVPHFMDPKHGEPDEAHNLFEAWLNERGICTINMVFPGDTGLSDLLHSVSELNRRSRPVFILGGESRNGTNHSVVCCDGKIVCDPSQTESGIIGPCTDGYYWVTFFGHLQAAHPIKRSVAA